RKHIRVLFGSQKSDEVSTPPSDAGAQAMLTPAGSIIKGCRATGWRYPLATSTNVATLFKSFIVCGVALMVALSPRSSGGCTLFGRFVQMTPPRRLGSSLKFALRASIGSL